MSANPSGTCKWAIVTIVMLGAALTVSAQYGGGTGEPNDPYLIYTAQQMDTIGRRSDHWSKHFRLMADIDLAAYTGTQFHIIGSTMGGVIPRSFQGVFDGNGHMISNFTYSSSDSAPTGLFRRLEGREAEIKNLGLISPVITAPAGVGVGALVGTMIDATITNCYVVGGSVTGDQRVGALVGCVPYTSNTAIGLIDRCYASDCLVSGDETVGGLIGENRHVIANCWVSGRVVGMVCAGGLAGFNKAGGVLANCHSLAGTSAEMTVGGLVGYNAGGIRNCYSIGPVAGSTRVGGLVGEDSTTGGLVTDSFWNKETSGQATSAAGKGRTTAALQDPATFVAAGWEVSGFSSDPSAVWIMSPDSGYPLLWYEVAATQQPPLPAFSGGTGTAESPYLIASAEQLNSIAHNPRLMTAHFRLVDDIDLTGIELLSLGSESVPFAGVFDGDGKTIANLTHTSAGREPFGVFGHVRGRDMRILNTNLLSPHMDAREGHYVGALVGHLYSGTVSNCHVQGGTVSGRLDTGGLVGLNRFGVLEDCSASAAVTGDLGVGGLVGNDMDGVTTRCHTVGPVAGAEDVGGLAGLHGGSMTSCYATGPIAGKDWTGGLIGDNTGRITNSYAAGAVAGEAKTGGLVGEHRGYINESFATGGVVGKSKTGGLVGSNLDMIINCYAWGNVTGADETGGLVGSNYAWGTVTGAEKTAGLVQGVNKCYSTGQVSGIAQIGGLVGRNTGYAAASSFWDRQTSGQPTSASGTGKTTAEMYAMRTFRDAHWDFDGETANGTADIWWIREGQGYPRLWWERGLE